ncbi:MAG: hypothetical protein E6964_17425 [Escherichia coli]|nr:hypothetical protein [Escherichia coli]
MTAARAYFVSMFILPPCEEGTTIQIVQVWVGSPRVDRNIVLGLHLSRPQSKPETGKLQAPAVILPLPKKETFQNFRISPSRSDFYTE